MRGLLAFLGKWAQVQRCFFSALPTAYCSLFLSCLVAAPNHAVIEVHSTDSVTAD